MPSGATAVGKDTGLRAGEILAGQYRVERILGSGGMGVVVAARDEETGEAVALKLLRSVDDTRAVERFFREARTMGKIDSEHVVRVRDAGSIDGKRPYLVMECLSGIDLSERSKRAGPLEVKEAFDYAIQACEALSQAHSKGIVHRDVKPSNLFLHVEGERTILKVLDFGISKVQSREIWERTLTTTDDGGVLGSPPYMSPEQVRDPKTVDARTDVWSLGVVLYKLLSGTVPYDGESVGEVFAKVLERPYPSLRTTTNVPAAVDAIVQRCLTKDRNARWSSVGELALALAPFASAEWASLAPRIKARMEEEGPTIDAGSSSPDGVALVRDHNDEPRTMTLSEPPPPEARGSGVPAPPAEILEILASPVVASPIVASPVVAPVGTRSRVALLLGVAGVAIGVAIGVAVRSGARTNDGPVGGGASTSSGVATVPVELDGAAGLASAPALASAAAPTSASAATTVTGPVKGGKARGTRRGAASAGAASGGTRPELQPSPYPTPP